MQGLILAAGMGKRLGERTADRTKCMVEFNGRTLLERMLDQLERSGIRRTTIVVGYQAESLREKIGDSFREMEIRYIHNPIFDKTNNIYSLYLAKETLLEDETILLESDLVFEDAVLERLLDDPRPDLAVVSKYAAWMDGTVLTLSDEDAITGFIPKSRFDFADVDRYFKTVNIYRFSREFSSTHYVPFLEAYCKAMGHNEYYEQVLHILTLLEEPSICALRLDREKWYEIDTPLDLACAETLLAAEENELESYTGRYGGFWRFPFLLDFCYLVNPFFPPQRLLDEMRTHFEALLTRYPSGQEVNRSLAAGLFGCRPNEIVVGNGAAELIHVLQQNHGGVTGVIRPSFEEYAGRTSEARLRVFEASAPHFRYSAEELLAFCRRDSVDRLVLINPDNPSGFCLETDEIARLATELEREGRSLILDESFVDFADDRESFFASGRFRAHRNMTLVKSVSKSFGVPGLRLGIAASADLEAMDRLSREVSIWNVNSFGEFFLQIFGKYEPDYQKARRLFAEERRRFHQRLSGIGSLRVLASRANYFLCEVLLPETPEHLTRTLLREKGILIRDCSRKPGIHGPYVRIAVRAPEENDYLVGALTELYLSGGGSRFPKTIVKKRAA